MVRRLELRQLRIEATHTEVEATYAIVKDGDGTPYLQIDTYGSEERKLQGKQSQSIRLAPEAIAQLRVIFDRHFGERAT
ncbi:hypothetical protein [Roseisolibacter sp. H3M3-2]|uniref:hypothetical protein n=1 Tax=Roseisolibacter sp. H3M3-2 TaxID=3031323 RepID=UPI0023DA7D25|nr:hypothetical protein [Roseisolibacter sp. H3M3-2]